MYTNPDSDERKHHEATYGPLEKFGYKDFIPMFTGKDFDPDARAQLFKQAGARFAGPVAEHHDGFSMWDTKYSEWNAAKMGPKRDVVGELSKSIKKQNMKFLTAFHHAENWFYFPTWDERYDTSNRAYAGLYGRSHPQGALPDKQFLDRWEGKIIEVIDKYGPDVMWFDFGLKLVHESYKKDVLAYYFNKGLSDQKEVTIIYKWHDLVPGVGIDDLELGQELNLTYNEWITDTTIDSGSGWGYVKAASFKSADELVTGLVDRASKNGFLLLNVGPKPDGTIPEEAKERLIKMGKWSPAMEKPFTIRHRGWSRQRGRPNSRRRARSTRRMGSSIRLKTFASRLRTTFCTQRFSRGRAKPRQSRAWSPRAIRGRACILRRSLRSRC